MSGFIQLQHKNQLTLVPAAPTSSFLRPARPFAPTPTTTAEQVVPEQHTQFTGVARAGHSLASMALFPPDRSSVESRASGIQCKAYSSTSSSEIMPPQEDASVIKQVAQIGIRTPSTTLPFAERVQQSFRHHDISHIQAHLGPESAASAEAMHAAAYTSGDHVVFAGRPTLSTVAHEAAHVVQQRGGVQLTGGIGKQGDVYERHADAVAERVKTGRAAEDLLDQFAGGQDKPQGTRHTADAPIQHAQYTDIGGGNRTNIYNTANFVYNTQNRERPHQVVAYVYATGRTKPVPPDPKSFLSPGATDMAGQDLIDFLGYHRGHIIAHTLGGTNASYNVVPMKPSFNTGRWRLKENQISAQVRTPGLGGGNYRVTITMAYPDQFHRIPNSFTVVGEYLDPSDNTWKTDAPISETIPHQVAEINVLPLRQAEITTSLGTLGGVNANDIYTRAAARLNLLISRAERQYKLSPLAATAKAQELRNNRHMPALGRHYPAEAQHRPYEELDILYLAGDLNIGMQDPPSAGSAFNDAQRSLILEVNATRHGNHLQSDDPTDPNPQLSLNGVKDHPEIDHTIPSSRGGSNWFSNARVISWELNNKLDRVKDPRLFMEPSTIEFPRDMKLEEAVYLTILRHGPLDALKTLDRLKGLIRQIKNPHTIKEGRKQLAVKDLKRADIQTILDDLVVEGKLVLAGAGYAVRRPGPYR